MTDVVIAGIGQVAVGEHWDISLRTLASRAIRAAIKDAGGLKPQALYIGNYLAPMVSHQANLGALLADEAGLKGIEAYTAEAAGASGAAAFHLGYLAVASEYVDTAVVLGVEKYNDMVGAKLESAVAQSEDYDYEMVNGLVPVGQAAILMQRYLYEYSVPRPALGEFPLLMHANAVNNPFALYRKPISREAYDRAEVVADPLNLFDVAPYNDGAAAVVLTRPELAGDPKQLGHGLVRVTGSNLAIDTLAMHDRRDPLEFEAARRSVERACRQAGIMPQDVDFFELSDSFSVYAALSLEAAGFARRGEGWKLALDGGLSLKGKLPINTLGGLKGRGNPLGATGVYQLVEAALQLRGQAGANQLVRARRGLVQSLGGPAATAVTHVLERS
jgi:acetyl-CoA C-acetyltransferase